MKTHTATTLTAEGIIFPEGPRWHGGKLWFSDIHGERGDDRGPGRTAGEGGLRAEPPVGTRLRCQGAAA